MADTGVSRPSSRDEFHVAVICALKIESDAVEAMFDEIYEGDRSYGKARGDASAYTTGRIGSHDVVLTYMSNIGKGVSAGTAARLGLSFPGIRLGLVVGICGGVPTCVQEDQEMLLGDVIVSTRVVQVDLGRKFPDKFVRKNTIEDELGRPNLELRAFLNQMQGWRASSQLTCNTFDTLNELLQKDGFRDSRYPGASNDILFPPTYRHKHHVQEVCSICAKCLNETDEVCDEVLQRPCAEAQCNSIEQVRRNRLEALRCSELQDGIAKAERPAIHFGCIGSGDMVIKSGNDRDRMAKDEHVIAFEMEGAGVWDHLPTVVIKSVCDYADSHKNKQWQRYAAASAASCMKAFLKEWRPQDESSSRHEHDIPDTQTAGNKHWMVTRTVNNLFTGRTELLERIQVALRGDELSSARSQKRFIITGMGGQGKSEICLKIAHLMREEFWAIFWIDVSDTSRAASGFIEAANLIGSSAGNLEQARQILANARQSWLLILDNADDPDLDYQEYFPSGDHGAVIVTSRLPECHRYETVGSEALTGLDLEHSTQLLLQAARIPEASRWSHEHHAQEVVRLLGSHTLALIQAGAYIAKGHGRLKQYPEVFHRQRSRLLKYRPNQAQSRYRDVYATFEASAHILQHSEDDSGQDALHLLGVLSTLSCSTLPLHIFENAWKGSRDVRHKDAADITDIGDLSQWHTSQLPGFIEVDSEEWDPYRLDEATSLLASLSLVTLESSGALSMHPLTHAWAKDRQQPELQRQSWITTGCVVTLSWNAPELWGVQQRELPTHIKAYLDLDMHTATSLGPKAMIVPLFAHCGWILENIREDSSLDQLLQGISTELGVDISTPSKEKLGICILHTRSLSNLGHFEKSIELLKQMVKIQETTLAETDPDRLRMESNLANSYWLGGHINEAMELFEYIVKIRNSILEETHPNRLASQHGLAISYYAAGQISRALGLMEHVVRIKETVYAEDNSHLLASQHGLAIFYRENGQTKEAVELLEHVVKIQGAVVADTHADLLVSQKELGLCYEANGQIKQALEIVDYVLAVEFYALPHTHPNRLASQHAMAVVLRADGQLEEAESELEYILWIGKATQSETNTDRLTSQHVLAGIYRDQDQIDKAVELLEHVVKIQATVFSETHPQRLASEQLLAMAYRDRVELDKAIELLERIIELQRATLDESHPDLQCSIRELEYCHQEKLTLESNMVSE